MCAARKTTHPAGYIGNTSMSHPEKRRSLGRENRHSLHQRFPLEHVCDRENRTVNQQTPNGVRARKHAAELASVRARQRRTRIPMAD